MAKQNAVAEEKPGIVQRVKTFYEDVVAEMKKVTWPNRLDLITSTKVTLFLIAVLMVVVYVYDNVLGFVVMQMLNIAAS